MNERPSLQRPQHYSFELILSHIDPGPAEESEAFVNWIHGQRSNDLTANPPAPTKSSTRT